MKFTATALVLCLAGSTAQHDGFQRCPLVDCSGRCLPPTLPSFTASILPLLTDAICDDGVGTYFDFNCDLFSVDGARCSSGKGEGSGLWKEVKGAPTGEERERLLLMYLEERKGMAEMEENTAAHDHAAVDAEALYEQIKRESRGAAMKKAAGSSPQRRQPGNISAQISSFQKELESLGPGEEGRRREVRGILKALYKKEQEVGNEEIDEGSRRAIFQLRKELEDDSLSTEARASIIRTIAGIEKSSKAAMEFKNGSKGGKKDGLKMRRASENEEQRSERELKAVKETMTLGKSIRTGKKGEFHMEL